VVHAESRGRMKILLVASDAREFSGLVSRASDVRPLALPIDLARSARLGAHDIVLAANGVGAAPAAAAVDAACRDARPDLIVSFGFCGGLDPRLGHGDVVVATGIAAGARTFPTAPVSAPPAQCGIVCSTDHVVQTGNEKRLLHASGAIAVEMEAGGVASRAEALGIPIACIRAVTDIAGETLANDFNSALRSDGHFATMNILRGALRHPMVRFPELFRLRNRCVRASRALGDFIVDCRF